MHTSRPPHALIVGGLGGSGTRAVAESLEALGFSHGPLLNVSEDCLAFTYLFVRTAWMEPSLPSVHARLERLRTTVEVGDPELSDTIESLSTAITRRNAPSGSGPFLIKEPNTHIFAYDILNSWADAAFMFVHRNPLDMALSSNTNQLKRWGPALGFSETLQGSVPAAQLALWLKAYNDQIKRQERFPRRTVALDYDAFVHDPVSHLHTALQGLGIHRERADLEAACRNVHAPPSQGRGQTQDLSVFSDTQLQVCRDQGWL